MLTAEMKRQIKVHQYDSCVLPILKVLVHVYVVYVCLFRSVVFCFVITNLYGVYEGRMVHWFGVMKF